MVIKNKTGPFTSQGSGAHQVWKVVEVARDLAREAGDSYVDRQALKPEAAQEGKKSLERSIFAERTLAEQLLRFTRDERFGRFRFTGPNRWRRLARRMPPSDVARELAQATNSLSAVRRAAERSIEEARLLGHPIRAFTGSGKRVAAVTSREPAIPLPDRLSRSTGRRVRQTQRRITELAEWMDRCAQECEAKLNDAIAQPGGLNSDTVVSVASGMLIDCAQVYATLQRLIALVGE